MLVLNHVFNSSDFNSSDFNFLRNKLNKSINICQLIGNTLYYINYTFNLSYNSSLFKNDHIDKVLDWWDVAYSFLQAHYLVLYKNYNTLYILRDINRNEFANLSFFILDQNQILLGLINKTLFLLFLFVLFIFSLKSKASEIRNHLIFVLKLRFSS